MKKAISLLVLMAMVLSLGLAATGCKATETDTGDTGSFSDAIPGGSADVSREVLEALTNSGTISTYIFGGSAENNESSEVTQRRNKFIDYYEQVYGGKVEYEYMVWENWEDNYITKFAVFSFCQTHKPLCFIFFFMFIFNCYRSFCKRKNEKY